MKKYILLTVISQLTIHLCAVYKNSKSDVYWLIPVIIFCLYLLCPLILSVFYKPNKLYKALICIVSNYILMYVWDVIWIKENDHEGKELFLSIRIAVVLISALIFVMKNDQEIASWFEKILRKKR